MKILGPWLGVVGLVFVASCATAFHERPRQDTPETLDAAGTAELKALVTTDRLADLQWPNFSDHAASVKDFYDHTGYKLGWISGGKPTQQAQAVVEILEQAERKGLNSIDYDGSRWSDRLKALQAGASESTLIKFDVALTVSAIRYLSDLHLGKVDPKVLHKDFDPERPEHDPGAFLAKEVIHAPNVSEVLAQVEPPFAGYQRTIAALAKYLQLAQHEVPDPLSPPPKPISAGQNYDQLEKLARRLQFRPRSRCRRDQRLIPVKSCKALRASNCDMAWRQRGNSGHKALKL